MVLNEVFSPTINLGQVFEIIGLVGGLIGTIYYLKGEVSVVKEDIHFMKTKMDKITEILIMMGRQDERLNFLDKRVDGLEKR